MLFRLAGWIEQRISANRARARLYRKKLHRGWLATLRVGKVLWVARVSTASVLLGFIVMSALPQARDVFADTSPGVVWWSFFFVALFWLWAVPVHYAARRALAWEDWATPRDSPLLRSSRRRDERGRLLPVEERTRLQAMYETPVKWIPRLLGLACFVAVYVGLSGAAENLEPANSLARADEALAQIGSLKIVTVILFFVFLVFVCYRRDLMAGWFKIKGKSGTADFTYADDANSKPVPAKSRYAIVDGDLTWFRHLLSRRRRHAYYADATADLYFDLVVLGLIAIISVAFLAAFIFPFELSGKYARRAVLLVFMLGAWVLGLTYLSAWSHRLKAPLIVLVIGFVVVISTLSTRFHDVRAIEQPTPPDNPPSVAERQKRLDQAILEWKELHNISGKDCLGAKSGCARPIIVAGQGGASRAAFFTATVLGELLDRTRYPELLEDAVSAASPGGTSSRPDDFGRRLFAISSVSGSSLGAVVFRAALADASDIKTAGAEKPPSGQTSAETAKTDDISAPNKEWRWQRGPCHRPDDQWFHYSNDRTSPFPWTWRDCLQVILSGDFLSPVFVGLAFRDHLSIAPGRFNRPLWTDRATLLEEAWERRYEQVVATGQIKQDATPVFSQRLAEKFGYVAGRVSRAGGAPEWMPLLFLNGSSVTTGRRIVVSDVQPWFCGSKLRLDDYKDDRSDEEKLRTILNSGNEEAKEKLQTFLRKGGASQEEIDILVDRDNRKSKPFQLYSEAYDFFELRSGITNFSTAVSINDACPEGKDSGQAMEAKVFAPAADIRMSTAATLSARFPIVSPHGVVRNLSGDVTDYVVDGGYFENDGLVTASDIAKALMAHRLRPVIVRITNEPEPPRDASEGAPNVIVRPPPPKAGEIGWWQGFLAPLFGLYQTRAGHGVEAAKAVFEMYDRVDRAATDEADSAKFIEIKVYDTLLDTSVNRRTCKPMATKFSYPATMEEISMSWWLSQPVQEYLDAQLCHPANRESLRQLLEIMKPSPAAQPDAGVAVRNGRERVGAAAN
jgi:hypothetical protein